MPRIMLTDEQWTKLEVIMLKTGRIYNKPEHRNFQPLITAQFSLSGTLGTLEAKVI